MGTTTTHEYSAINERRWERVLLVLATVFLFVAVVLMGALQVQVLTLSHQVKSRNKDIRTVTSVVRDAVGSSKRAEQAANAVNDGIDKRSPARQREQAQIASIDRRVARLVKELDR